MPKMTAIRAIRAKCLNCVCFQPQEVKLCPSESCPLWPYRMGHMPKERRDIVFTGGKYVIAKVTSNTAPNEQGEASEE